jgi:transcriptional antiterminator RfaH
MHWYLIHTKPRQENIALENLQQQGYTCYLPLFNVEKIRRGKFAVVLEALFPRYLFIQLDTALSSQSWTPIRSTKGVNRLVAFGGQPVKVDETLVSILKVAEENQPERLQKMFAAGDKVQLTQGAFAGLEGIYQMADGESRAMVLIEILNKPVRIAVEPAELRKRA